MSHLLPYLGAGLLLFAVMALWARLSSVHRRDRVELLMPRQRRSGVGSSVPDGDLSERIFDPEDWDFVSREAPPEIQRMFLRERTVLVISWLRRAKSRISQAMGAHVTAAGQNEDLQLGTETKLALTYLLFLILCQFMIGLIWLRGPVGNRKIVGQMLHWAAQLLEAFERLMAVADPQPIACWTRVSIKE